MDEEHEVKDPEEKLELTPLQNVTLTVQLLHRSLLKLSRSDHVTRWKPVREILREHSDADQSYLKQALQEPYGEMQTTFLHVICMHDPPTDVVETVLHHASTRIAFLTDSRGMLPIHIACKYRASTEVVFALVKSNRESIRERDHEMQRVPLHYALDHNALVVKTAFQPSDSLDSIHLDENLCLPETVAHVSSKDVITLKDKNGLSPFDVLALSCHQNVCHSRSQGHHRWDNNTKNLTFCERASAIVSICLDCEPDSISAIFTSLQAFPKWLIDHALQHQYVRRCLDERTGQPLFCMFFLLDIVMEIILIWSFTLGFQRTADPRFDLSSVSRSFPMVILLVGAIYFLFRTSMKLGGFVKAKRAELWTKDFWNCCDMLHSFLLVFSTCILFQDGDTIEQFVGLFILTGGVQWLHLVTLLRAASISFSVFVASLLHICLDIVPFLVTTFIFIGSFAFMYFASKISSPSCIEYRTLESSTSQEVQGEEGTLSNCSPGQSFLQVFEMFIDGMSEGSFTGDTKDIMISFTFAFTMILLQLNVLIAVVTETYGRVRSHGELVFWMERFYYVCSLEAVKQVLHLASCQCLYIYEERLTNWMRSYWNDAVHSRMCESSFTSRNKTRVPRKMSLFGGYFGRILLLFLVVPIWLALGLFTLGLLWPPQVREFLFCQHHLYYDNEHKYENNSPGQNNQPKSASEKRECVPIQFSDEETSQIGQTLKNHPKSKTKESNADEQDVQVDVNLKLEKMMLEIDDIRRMSEEYKKQMDDVQGMLRLLLQKGGG